MSLLCLTCLSVLPGFVWQAGTVWAVQPEDFGAKEQQPFERSGIWDNNLIDADSGVEFNLQDPNSSEDKSGIKKDLPQTFFIPPPRQFDDVDPEELDEQAGKDYTPHALVQVRSNIRYRNVVLKKGYYQVKLGQIQDGSPNSRLHPQDAYLAAAATGMTHPASTQHYSRKYFESTPSVFVLKQLGKVIAVLPITRVTAYQAPKGEKPPKKPVAVIEYENNQPVMKVYYKKNLYWSALGLSS